MTQRAAMVKLRLLIGPFGLGEEEDSDADSLRQVVAFLDAGDGAATREPP